MHFQSTLLILCYIINAAHSDLFNSPLPGPSSWSIFPGQFKEFSVKGDSVWAITKQHETVRWSDNKWSAVKGDASQVAATADGNVFALSNTKRDGPSSASIVQYDAKTNRLVQPSCGNDVSYINAFSVNPVKLVGIGSTAVGTNIPQDRLLSNSGDGCVLVWDEKTKCLIPQDINDCNNYKVAIGENDEQWKIDLNGLLHRLEGKQWKQQEFYNTKDVMFSMNPRPPFAVDLDVQSKDRVVVLTVDGVVNVYDGKAWSSFYYPGGMSGEQLRFVQVGINKKSVFGLDAYGTLRKKDI